MIKNKLKGGKIKINMVQENGKNKTSLRHFRRIRDSRPIQKRVRPISTLTGNRLPVRTTQTIPIERYNLLNRHLQGTTKSKSKKVGLELAFKGIYGRCLSCM